MKKAVAFFMILVFFIGGGYVVVNFWPYIFAKTIQGEVMKVERLIEPVAVLTEQNQPSDKIFSFAVAIKDRHTGEIFTASTEDRQWAAVQGEGLCAKAKFFPYPPWNFQKSGTYFGARLLGLWSCKDQKSQ